MKNVMQLVSFKLKDESMLDDWKKMSGFITEAMNANAEGLISRVSGIDSEGNIYCILKWKNQEKMLASQKAYAEGDFDEDKKRFEALVDMSTMKQDRIELF